MKKTFWIAAIAIAAPTSLFAGQTIAEPGPQDRVTVSGIVDRIADEDTFILRDHTGQIPVYLGPNMVPVSVGTAVTVHGIFDDDAPQEIYADRMETDTGTSFRFDHTYE